MATLIAGELKRLLPYFVTDTVLVAFNMYTYICLCRKINAEDNVLVKYAFSSINTQNVPLNRNSWHFSPVLIL